MTDKPDILNHASEHFTFFEFRCRCGCGLYVVQRDLIEALEELRGIVNQPIIVTSGIRCAAHNAAVGGASHSQHLLGKAADIYVEGMDTYQLKLHATSVQSFNWGGIGIYQRFVHVDTRDGPARWEG